MDRTAKRGGWQARYGARRRAIDRALLAECERQIEADERARLDAAIVAAITIAIDGECK